jgi:hypothetical protein
MMTDKHGVEVKLGDKVIGIDMSYNPPLHIGKITDIDHYDRPLVSDIISLRENICDSYYTDHPRFYSHEFELWTSERELIAKLEV